MRWLRATLFGLTWVVAACSATEPRIIVAPDGSKALYVECTNGPIECLSAISEQCRGGYEVLAQSSRDETLMLDKVTEAGTQALASKYVSPNAKGIEATPSNIRQMLVRCGRTTTAASDLQKLLGMPTAAKTAAAGSAKTSPPPNPAPQAAADDDAETNWHTCPGDDATIQAQRAAQWRNIRLVQKTGASRLGVSSALACNMARTLFVERCPTWSPYVTQVARDVCTIAQGEALRAARVAKASAPVVEPVVLEESP